MATFSISNVTELLNGFKAIASLPEDVKAQALTKMANIAAEKQKSTGMEKNVYDRNSDVHILDNIVAKKPEITDDGGKCLVTFSGTRQNGRKRVRNAEIAFIQEYGSSKIQAKEFIRTANEKYADEINKAGAEIILNHIEQKFGGNA